MKVRLLSFSTLLIALTPAAGFSQKRLGARRPEDGHIAAFAVLEPAQGRVQGYRRRQKRHDRARGHLFGGSERTARPQPHRRGLRGLRQRHDQDPNNPSQTLPRISYSGGFTVEAKADGYTDAKTILANYLRAGAAGAENSSFKGNVVMKPENPSASARALGDALIKNLQQTATGAAAVTYDTEIDAVRFEGFTVPHVGLRDSASCSWTGDAIYAYANDARQMKFNVKCGDRSFALEGNMPLVDAAAGSPHQQEYKLNLVLPGPGGGDLFAAADPFATVDGVTGTIKLTNSGRSTKDGVYETVKVQGELDGVGVPLELTRSFAEISRGLRTDLVRRLIGRSRERVQAMHPFLRTPRRS